MPPTSPIHRADALASAMGRDRAALARRMAKADRMTAPQQARLDADIDCSVHQRETRNAHRPRPTYADDLPIHARREEIIHTIREHPVVIVAGETGSGKTTQLPKMCLDAGFGAGGMIGHTQPRRIAARSLSARIAEEMNVPLGGVVGDKIRFHDRTAPDTWIKVMTDGILLAEIQGDPDLLGYEVIIVDEAHERSLNIDFLLGVLKQLISRRPELRVIVTSATIDTQRFSAHFGGAPVIQIAGRTYPVSVRYRPQEENGDSCTQADAIVAAVAEASEGGDRGDILVFLSGEREIKEAAAALGRAPLAKTEIVPLFARLSAAEQQRVFNPGPKRRIVLATNVAETSLTVPRIRYVIDTGVARVSRYSTRSRVQRLPVERISQAAANQRMGRCGRTSDGICIRLYSEDDFNDRPEFTEPEIRRTNLAAVILRMLDLGLGEIADFPVLDPPDRRQISDGFALLTELGAVDGNREISDVGRRLARFPVDPRLARMLIAADAEGALAELLVVTAVLSVRDPRERPLDAAGKADAAHAPFRDDRSDIVGLLKLWAAFEDRGHHLSRTQLRKWCAAQYISFIRMREWRDLHRDLSRQVREMGMHPNEQPADYPAIHRAVLAGTLGHLGKREERRQYQAAGGGQFVLFPGSSVTRKPPPWVVAVERVETTQSFARTVARIEPEWVEQVAPDRIKKHWFEPRWSRRQGAVIAWERVSLYGLILCPQRPVPYGPIDPTAAREIFLRDGMVGGAINTRGAFLVHNQDRITAAEDRAARTRDANAGVDEEALFQFFDGRIPADIHNMRDFEKWRRQAEQTDAKILFLSDTDLRASAESAADLHPDSLVLDGVCYPLSYHFHLGDPADGVTLTVPLARLASLPSARLDWLVPGMLADKATALLRTLPGKLRRAIQPPAAFARRFADTVPADPIPLVTALAAYLEREAGVAIPPSAWRPEAITPYLAMRIRVVTSNGDEVAVGRDLDALRSEFDSASNAAFDELPKGRWERTDLTAWDVGDLAESVPLSPSGDVIGFPALVAADGAGNGGGADGADKRVCLRLFADRETARTAHAGGVRALARRTMAPTLTALRKGRTPERTALRYAAVGGGPLQLDAMDAAYMQLAATHGAVDVRTEAEFTRFTLALRAELGVRTGEKVAAATPILECHGAVMLTLQNTALRGAPESLSDIQAQCTALIHPTFLRTTPPEWLPHLARFLEGIQVRLTRMQEHPDRDLARMRTVAPLLVAFQTVADADPNACATPEYVAFRFLLEELRVSCFAQHLGTSQPVSIKRLTAHWQRLHS